MRIIAGFLFVASVAANIIQALPQPNAAAPSTSNAADSGSADSAFAAILATLSTGGDTQQPAAQPANDATPSDAGNAVIDSGKIAQPPANAAQAGAVQPQVSAVPDAAIMLPKTIASLLQNAAPQKPGADAKPANDTDNSAAGDQPASSDSTASGDNSALAALLMQQQPLQTSIKAAPVNMDGEKAAAPVDAAAPKTPAPLGPADAPAPPAAAAPDTDQAAQSSSDAKAAPDAVKPNSITADTLPPPAIAALVAVQAAQSSSNAKAAPDTVKPNSTTADTLPPPAIAAPVAGQAAQSSSDAKAAPDTVKPNAITADTPLPAIAAPVAEQAAQNSSDAKAAPDTVKPNATTADTLPPPAIAAPVAGQAAQNVKVAKAAPDAAKQKAAPADARARADKIELPKAFAQAAPEKASAPAPSDNNDSKPAPAQSANGKQSGQQDQDRQANPRDTQVQANSGIDAQQSVTDNNAPQSFANNNTPDLQQAQPVAAKPDAPALPPQSINIAAIAGPNAATTAAPNTAATLHSVSTLRDAAPDLHSMAVQISSYSAEDVKHFQIRMDPAELGRVEVHLTVDDAGKTQATMLVEKPHALEALQNDAPALERALKDAGVDLSNNGLNFSLKGQERQQDSGARSNSRSRSNSVMANAKIDGIVAANTNYLASGNTGLDIRV